MNGSESGVDRPPVGLFSWKDHHSFLEEIHVSHPTWKKITHISKYA
jgi:hypothetical protein